MKKKKTRLEKQDKEPYLEIQVVVCSEDFKYNNKQINNKNGNSSFKQWYIPA